MNAVEEDEVVVLVIDDEPDIRSVISMELSLEGFAVETARTVSTASPPPRHRLRT